MRNVWAILATLALVLTAAPAAAVDATSIAVSTSTVGATAVTVTGVLTLGDDALAPVTVSTDAAGDARPNAAGLDLGDTTMTVDYSATAPRLIVQQKVQGSMASADGNPPALGYGWPIAVSGATGDPRWRGAGSRGTNFTPRDGWWTGVCSAGSAGWSCASDVEGVANAEGITWKVPFSMIQGRVGRTIGGSTAFGGNPRSFVWPSAFVLMGTAPSDTASNALPYLIPGLVEAGIAPVGVPIWEVPFVANPSTNSASFNARTGAFSMNVPKPSTTGDHTLWVRSCFGDPEAPTCAVTQQPIVL
jgi:hypothetical protein